MQDSRKLFIGVEADKRFGHRSRPMPRRQDDQKRDWGLHHLPAFLFRHNMKQIYPGKE